MIRGWRRRRKLLGERTEKNNKQTNKTETHQNATSGLCVETEKQRFTCVVEARDKFFFPFSSLQAFLFEHCLRLRFFLMACWPRRKRDWISDPRRRSYRGLFRGAARSPRLSSPRKPCRLSAGNARACVFVLISGARSKLPSPARTNTHTRGPVDGTWPAPGCGGVAAEVLLPRRARGAKPQAQIAEEVFCVRGGTDKKMEGESVARRNGN